MNVLIGGFVKITEGKVFQYFDDQGKCVAQHFEASDADFRDEDNQPLDINDLRLEISHPYKMERPEAAGCPGFICPDCGGNRIEMVSEPGIVVAELIDIENASYADFEFEEVTPCYFRCWRCSYAIASSFDELRKEVFGTPVNEKD